MRPSTEPRDRGPIGRSASLAALALCVVGSTASWSFAGSELTNGVAVSGPVSPQHSIRLSELPLASSIAKPPEKGEDRENPLEDEPDQGHRGTWDRAEIPFDPLAASSLNAAGVTPPATRQWDGTGNPVGCDGCTPPDIVGDVGAHHYVQIVNATKVTIYDKQGTLLFGPADLDTFWSSGHCAAGNPGDPIVVYDRLADRWLLAQFASPHDICIAISASGDPLASYFIYDFSMPAGGFPDYYKIGVWPDGYYLSANQHNYSAMAVDRSRMLIGASASLLRFARTSDDQSTVPNLMLPAHVGGLTPPPPGSPGYFFTFLDDAFHGVPADRVRVYALHADFHTPANSTFTIARDIDVAPFTYTVCGFFNLDCVPQAETGQKVDAISEWPMFRLDYRNYGDHEALAGNFTVPNGGVSAPRWFELRRVGAGKWTLFQEGTYAPDATSRWMSSIASDHQGDLALGFSESSSAIHPRIRYATRLASDPPGTLRPEAVLIDGGGSQTGSNRWGDYSTMSVDPANDCDFYYTSEYYSADATNAWRTRIGTFTIPECNVIFLDGFEVGTTNRWTGAAP